MINLLKLLELNSISLEHQKYKIHLATGFNPTPLEAFFEGTFEEWQKNQTKKNFPCDYVISLIFLQSNRWLFAGVYKILGVTVGNETKYKYKTELLDGQDDLIGRIIIYYKRKYRASYLWGDGCKKDLTVSEILPKRMTIEEFPGYNSVLISHYKLKIIISEQTASWKSSLSNVSGIYLIVDISTGKQYIGSALGGEGIWQRWSDYAKNGHGGNIELKNLLKTQGSDYVKNFQYTILEIFDTHVRDEDIVQREAYWKNVLLTREFGYNLN